MSKLTPYLDLAKRPAGVDLKQLSLAHLIFEIIHSKATGVLTLQHDKVVRRLSCREGVPLTVLSNLRSETLAPLLQKLGKINEAEAQQLQSQTAGAQQTPATLLASIKRLDSAAIKQCIDLLHQERLKLLLNVQQGTVFFSTSNPVAAQEPIPSFIRSLLDGCSLYLNSTTIQQHFTNIQPASCIQYDADAFYAVEKILTPEERGIATIASTATDVSDLYKQSFLTDLQKQQNLAKLLLLKVIQLENAEEKAERLLAAQLNPEQLKLKAQVQSWLQKDNLGGANYFELLQLHPDSNSHQIKQQYENLTKSYSLNQLKSLFSPSAAHKAGAMLQLLQRAYATLSDDKKRQEYQSFLKTGQRGRFEEKSKAVAIDKLLQSIAPWMQQQKWGEAFNACKAAMPTLGQEPRWIALCGYLVAMSGNLNKGNELMQKALGLDNLCIDAYLYQAEVMLAHKDTTNAQKQLAALLQIEPRHMRARELLTQLDGGESLNIEIEAIHKNLSQLDYYSLLDITPQAKKDEIQRAYHSKTKQFHPDRFFNSKDTQLKDKARTLYKRCVEAYMVLKNPNKRSEYDQQFLQAKQGEAQVRLRDASDVMQKKERSELVIKSAQARKFYSLALTSMQAGNFNGAIMNFQLALGLEPDHPAIKQKLEEAKQKAKA